MIIVEGPDGTGKTTLCERLAEKLKLQYIKIPRHKNDPVLNGFKFYQQQAEQLPLDCVVDRFHLGDRVYPTLYPDDLRSPLTIWQQHAIERVLLAKGALLIYVSAPPDWIIKNLQERNEPGIEISYPSLAKELELFNQSVANTLLYTRHYLTDLYHNDNPFISMLRTMEQHKRNIATVRQQYNATGSWAENPIVLVGDEVNPKYCTELAFNAWTGSSAYLHEALAIAGFNYPWYLTNSTNKDPVDLRHEIGLLQPLKVIALGTKATANLQVAMIPHVNFEHPSHHKRFNGNVYDYAWQLQQLVW